MAPLFSGAFLLLSKKLYYFEHRIQRRKREFMILLIDDLSDDGLLGFIGSVTVCMV
ncbi:hypothetical protein HanPI659440_Chr03g0119731 [Helianthus annuus]|nr:hypothetical protein HanPI659440_Chr03g0119731 [Helianthus annuus]